MRSYSKSLRVLKEEWQECTKCDLGVRRQEVGGHFVFGEGKPGGIMFIGEGPGEHEEKEGHPFVGQAGQLLRGAITKLGITDYYISNLVACRSCQQAHSGQGEPITRWNKRLRVNEPLMRDEPPFPMHIQACLPRLHEEIYLVDPLLIITLGAEATKELTGEKSVSITTACGIPKIVEIPGAWRVASLTEKKKAWIRKAGGQLVMPTEENVVSYLTIPMLHPAYVLRKHADKTLGNATATFIKDLKAAVAIYDRYQFEVNGIEAVERTIEAQDFEEENYE